MRIVLQRYEHAGGNHCASTSISRLLHFHGHQLSEALCFGLGRGIDFYFMHNDGLRPTRMMMGRGPNLETDCFAALGIPVTVRRTEDDNEAWQWVKSEIEAGRPAMVQVDIRWLDYYQTHTNFGGHKVLIVGYDEISRTALISDNEFDALQSVPLAGLAKARNTTAPPWDLQNDWYEIAISDKLTDLERAVPEAIRAVAQRMTQEQGPFAGLTGMDLAVEDLPSWGEAADWQWCARFAYQVIEKRGTGGGAFRKMYGEFLEQATRWCPDVERLGLTPQMQAIAATWTDFAYTLREISEYDHPRGFGQAAKLLQLITRLERAYYQDALECRCATGGGQEV